MACMRHRLCRGLPILRSLIRKKELGVGTLGVRTFLSPAYSCTETWQSRLTSPPLQGLDPNDFSLKLYEKFEKEGRLHAIDIDILANRMSDIDEEHLEFAEHLFYRFRRTNECLKMSESTPHALIRAYLQQGRIDRLLNILKKKLDHGIFLDYFTANMLLDHFLNAQQYYYAARIAYEMMHQEDFSHPLTRYLSWYACYMQLNNPPQPEPEQQTEKRDEEEEEQYILVNFIDNPWWDDHFDLQKDSHLLGKTLVMIGQMEDGILGTSSQLIGWGQFEKFEEGINLLKTSLKDKSVTFAKEALDQFSRSLSTSVAEEPVDEDIPAGNKTLDDVHPRLLEESLSKCRSEFEVLLPKLEAAGIIVNLDLHEELKKHVEDAVNKLELKDIEEQEKLFTQWNETRQSLVAAQIKEYTDKQKKQEILRKLEQIQEKEELLTFFENYDATTLAEKRALKQEKKLRHIRKREESDTE